MRRRARVFPLLACFSLTAMYACSAPVTDDPSSADQGDTALTQLDPKLEAAAVANLARIANEIDVQHLSSYASLPDASSADFAPKVAQAFLNAVKLEYQATPDLLKRRVQTLASMVFFSAPEVETNSDIGRVTPFHGLNDAGFDALMTNEDFVFNSHMSANGGSPNGVRPFSVCETKFLVGISKGEITDATFVSNGRITAYDAYAAAYEKYAGSCEQRDLDEWYNFRGLGGLRPSWLESNFNDRVLRRMQRACAKPSGDMKNACAAFKKDRLAYRDAENVALALREMVYDTAPSSTIDSMQDGDYMGNPNNAGVFVEDRNGDGVAEWLAPGAVSLVPNGTLKVGNDTYTVGADAVTLTGPGGSKAVKSATLAVQQQSQFGGTLALTLLLADGSNLAASASAGAIVAVDRVDPKWSKSLLGKPDLGLLTLFDSSSGCDGDAASPDKCALIRRFYSLIDRHESFYQTYNSLDPTSSSISSQPSPLVACSITLAAAHQWDRAGTPAGGSAGFIYLMRIPFAQILAGDVRSIDTLGRRKGGLTNGPKITTVRDLYAGTPLDMGKVWLDIATLSHNQYSNEHEVSKFGTVPAEQIEGVLVIRRPTAMGPAPSSGGGSGPDGGGSSSGGGGSIITSDGGVDQ